MLINFLLRHGRMHTKVMNSSFHQELLLYIRNCSTLMASENHFDKILVANRGEIACRVIKTARRMKIKTVAIYSTADTRGLHVRLADEAVCVGEAASQSSYLCTEHIIDAVHKTGAQAVHPGYGFLSESAVFAKQLEDLDITFIGPSSQVLELMGNKLASKLAARDAGVNVIPGCEEIISSLEDCLEAARKLGYPVMMKALAGGGGKGMRVVYNDQEARESFTSAKQEALSSFGNNQMLVEKFIENPRHIEVQVLGDKHGNVIHLYERECSIQRRHQKVIEEAPSMLLSAEQRAEMTSQAVSLCRAIGYSSAGTVEFLVEPGSGSFYFLEMNPRLQVEHPVTEAITGIDLVYETLEIARGHRLRLQQSDVPLNGWAIECRVYAENPFLEFGLPSVGRVFSYIEPTHLANVRCDSGVEEGSEISIHYDALISKLVCHAASRHEAVNLSIDALDAYVIRGVTHNIPLLRDVLSQPRFMTGDLSTSFLNQVYPQGFKGRQLSQSSEDHLLAAASCLYACEELRAWSSPTVSLARSQTVAPPPSRWQLSLSCGDKTPRLALVTREQGEFLVTLQGGVVMRINENINLASPLLPLSIDGSTILLQSVTRSASGRYKLVCEGTTFTVMVLTRLAAHYMQHMLPKKKTDISKTVTSPMPGLVKSMTCQPGDELVEGQEICVVEAMKMQNSVCASSRATVKEVLVTVGATVAKNEPLVLLF